MYENNDESIYDTYLNILLMVKYRGMSEVKSMDEKKFNEVFKSGLVKIVASKLNELMIICLFEKDSVIMKDGKSFSKLLDSIKIEAKDKGLNLMFICNSLEFVKKKRLPEINTKFKNERNDFYFEYCHYDAFACCVPEISTCKMEVAKSSEINEYINISKVSKNDFPKILFNDPHATWIGLRRGQFAKITRHTDTSGISIVYRYCI